MVDGDHIADEWVTGTVATTDGNATTIVTIAIPTSLDGVVQIEGWAIGQEIDSTLHTYYEKIVGVANIDGGLNLKGAGTSVEVADPDTSGWGGVTLSDSGSNLLLQVDGDTGTNIQWYGSMKIKVIEVDQDSGG